jgi:hypothetical protein
MKRKNSYKLIFFKKKTYPPMNRHSNKDPAAIFQAHWTKHHKAGFALPYKMVRNGLAMFALQAAAI